jgi:hypothetical protein
MARSSSVAPGRRPFDGRVRNSTALTGSARQQLYRRGFAPHVAMATYPPAASTTTVVVIRAHLLFDASGGPRGGRVEAVGRRCRLLAAAEAAGDRATATRCRQPQTPIGGKYGTGAPARHSAHRQYAPTLCACSNSSQCPPNLIPAAHALGSLTRPGYRNCIPVRGCAQPRGARRRARSTTGRAMAADAYRRRAPMPHTSR